MLCGNPGTSSSRAPVVDSPSAAFYIFDECRVVLLNFLCKRRAALVIFVSYFVVEDNDFSGDFRFLFLCSRQRFLKKEHLRDLQESYF